MYALFTHDTKNSSGWSDYKSADLNAGVNAPKQMLQNPEISPASHKGGHILSADTFLTVLEELL